MSGIRIDTTNISKRFNREWIFRDFSFAFRAGSTYAITGPNGSGKSTLLQILWGQIPATSGSISYTLNGSSITAEDIYRHLSIAAPYMDLIDEFTLIEQVRFHFSLKRIRPGSSTNSVVESMYLGDARQKYIGNFSSGMKQRLRVGLALNTEAHIYFLDEPASNLDEKAFDWYRGQLDRLDPAALILIASNNPAEYPENAQKLNLTDFK